MRIFCTGWREVIRDRELVDSVATSCLAGCCSDFSTLVEVAGSEHEIDARSMFCVWICGFLRRQGPCVVHLLCPWEENALPP